MNEFLELLGTSAAAAWIYLGMILVIALCLFLFDRGQRPRAKARRSGVGSRQVPDLRLVARPPKAAVESATGDARARRAK